MSPALCFLRMWSPRFNNPITMTACSALRVTHPHLHMHAYTHTQHAQILKAKTDKQFRSSLTVEYRDSMADRAAALTRWAHLAKQDERPEYVLIAKQVTRFRQLRNSCENEASKGQNWSPDDAPPSPVTVGGSPVVPPPLPPPPPTTASGSPSTPNTASTNSPSPRRKERRASVSASKKRQGSNIAMIKNRLRGASYHLGKMDFARLFRYYDRDNSGQIDRKEFISLVRRDGKIPPAKLSDLKLEKMFDTKLDLDGTGDVSHAEFVEWILEDPHHDGGGGQDQPPEYEDQGPPLDTFTRLYMSKPTYTQELKKSSPRSRRKSLNEPESGGDFRSILRSDFNNDTARQWRQDYHTRVDTKQAEYPPLYAWEEEKARAMGGGGDMGRKFASPVTASAQKAQDSHFMLNVEKLRIKSKLPSFHEQNNIAFGSRIPPKLPSPGEVKRRKAAERAAQKQAEREARPAWRNICNFTVVMNDDEAALYQRLRLSIPIEKDPFQAVSNLN